METGPNRSTPKPANLNSWRTLILVCFVAILSYCAARVGAILAMGPQADWPLWLGNVLLASILLLTPRKIWPMLVVAAFAAFAVNDIQAGLTIRTRLLLILSDALDVFTALFCLSYAFKGAPRLNSVRALAKFSLCAVILPPLIGASFVALAIGKGDYWVSWRISFFSEAIVYLTLMPAILGWFGKGPTQDKESRANYLEAALLIAGLVAFGYFAFAAPQGYRSEVTLYALVPFLLWAALRFGTTGASSATIAIAVLAIWGGTHGRGPFVESRPLNNFLSLQLFLLFTSAPFMVLAAVVEENKQASEQLFRSIFENAQIGIGIFNIQTGEHFSNKSMHEMLGYSQEELSHVEQWDEIVHPDERARGAERYSDLVKGVRDQDEYSQRFIRRDGRVVISNGRFRLLRDAAGRPQYVIAFSEDITERMHAEEEREHATQLFRSIFENAQFGINFFSVDGREHFSNHALHQMLGYTEEELSDLKRWDEIIHPDERAAGARRYAELLQGQRDRDEWEQRFVCRDGHIAIANGRFFLLRDAAGKPQYVVYFTEDITARKRAEEERERATQLFRSIFENAQIGIGIFNIQTGDHLSNRFMHEMLGYSQEELSRLERWDEIIRPDERAAGAERYAALIQGKREKDEWEQHFIRRDSRVVTADIRFVLLRDAADRPQYVFSFNEDITQRRRAEEALQASEQLFRSIFENAQIGISVFSVDGREFSCNRALYEMLGHTQEELSRLEHWDAIVHPDDRASGAERFAELLQGKREQDAWEQRFIHRDGRIVIVNGRCSLLRDDAGKPQYVVTLNEDITKRRRAEEALQASEGLFRSIFENAQIGISFFRIDDQRHVSNEALHEMLGYSGEELSHLEQWDSISHPDERDSHAQRYLELIEGKREQDELEQHFFRRDGQIVVTSSRFKLLRDAKGTPEYVVTLTEDITERKRAEAELVTAKEAAEAAAKSKSEFLANMSHEIRTPMNAIIGMTRLALKTKLTSKQEDYLSKIKAAADALLGIINDILDSSKIEAGKLDLEKTDFHLEEILENLSTVVSQKAHDKNLEFLIAARHDLPPHLVGDPLRLGQILINLVNNAVKFTEHGEVVVSVTMEERAPDRVKLKFSVRDSGIGMTPEQAARLFQAFSQANTSTTRKYGGTGLGLSISKRLVEMMGGNIWV